MDREWGRVKVKVILQDTDEKNSFHEQEAGGDGLASENDTHTYYPL